VVKEKKAVAAESLPRRLREIVNVIFNSLMKYSTKSREPKTYNCSSLWKRLHIWLWRDPAGIKFIWITDSNWKVT